MCGIAGISLVDHRNLQESIRNMTDAMAHRGPDGEGFFIEGNTAIGHKRLSIIDPNAGHQPMCNEDETVWITFNGCVYNYLELRQELVQKGHQIKTYSDTEVLIHAYEEWGKDCVSKFNGMFAFVIYDLKRNVLFGARDRFGVKPFYYYLNEKAFAFASEIKAIHASGVTNPETNADGISDYFVFQFTLGEKTMFKDVMKLAPGHCFSFNVESREFNVEEYWDLEFKYDTHHTEDYFVDQLMYLIGDATKIRLRSDVPLGCHLSGGMDSSTLVCLASELLGQNNLKTFTGRFGEGAAYDESPYAKIVSEHAKTDYKEVTMTSTDFLNSIKDIIHYMDEPAAGPGIFPQYHVSKLAAEHVKVVLGGQGGDEIFMGYARYLVAYLEESIKGAIFETADKDKHAVNLESIIPNLPILKTYQPMLQNFWKSGLFEGQDQRYYHLIDRSEGMKSLINLEAIHQGNYSAFNEFSKIFNKKEIGSYMNKMMYFDIKSSLPALLHVEDRTSMAVGLESRLPLLDYRIVELMASIPPNIKFAGGQSKAMFKKAIKNVVPSEIYNRKDKMGFPVPLVQWYGGELKDFVESTLLSDKAVGRGYYSRTQIEKELKNPNAFSRTLWGLLCLELWHQNFIDK